MFMKAFKEMWLLTEEPGHVALIQDITVSKSRHRKPKYCINVYIGLSFPT